ncbi:sensor histidine kinase [Piscinibacter sakaiensis]|uniref:histidine kinase n=1 Tax=Piscinibacter sakaiensis TaxID=1547922 RepID=A0A0K8P5K7_PISS1|nr:HAMP domain-containing sensor histidine kinase [Piscinibacter sakaiensis]GAP37993.1 periplasmic sensor signal transduction histidine kinase [Piscinibacter sakaiensis]
MKTLTLRIYLTVVAVLLLFAGVSGWLFQRHIDGERSRTETLLSDRMAAWAELIQRSLPGVQAPVAEQAAALKDWSERLRLPLALDDTGGRRVAASESYERREREPMARTFAVALEDGRTLWVMRPWRPRGPGGGAPPWLGGPGGARGPAAFGPGPDGGGPDAGPGGDRPPRRPPDGFGFWPWSSGLGWVVLLVLLFVAVAGAAWPVVRALTRRLAALKLGVERFGAGQLSHRVEVQGQDEVAAVAASFNQAAARIEALVRSHQSLLANASHELRSPLARMKMAISMLDDVGPAQRGALQREIHTNIAELDALVEEVLLASRLDAASEGPQRDPVDLLALAAEEAARLQAEVDGESLQVLGEERLLRRALRNLLENARRYGGTDVRVEIHRRGTGAELRVCDRGPGVPEDLRERIFEPFYRLPGHAEQAGGVGLGLSLVRQIAERHGGSVRCEAREGGGSCFVIALPAGA